MYQFTNFPQQNVCLFAYNLPQTFSLAIIFINLIKRQGVSLLVYFASLDQWKDQIFLSYIFNDHCFGFCVCLWVGVCVYVCELLVNVPGLCFPFGVLDFSNS